MGCDVFFRFCTLNSRKNISVRNIMVHSKSWFKQSSARVGICSFGGQIFVCAVSVIHYTLSPAEIRIQVAVFEWGFVCWGTDFSCVMYPSYIILSVPQKSEYK